MTGLLADAFAGGPVRFPPPLEPGDVVGVTAPSAGVPEDLRPRLDFCIAHLRGLGFQVRPGDCLTGGGVTSAPAAERAEELSSMLLDPLVRAVVPPWGGELAIDLLPLLDFAALAAVEPTWLVGYSDISTLLLPLTLLTGAATLHAPGLMDVALHVPEPLLHWLDVARAPTGSALTQGPATHFLGGGWPDYRRHPQLRDLRLTVPSRWRSLADDDRPVRMSGRLLGGCLETLAMLPGTPYGDVAGFADRYAPDGLLVYLETAETDAAGTARMLHSLRLAGWFDRAQGVLVGRTGAPAHGELSQLDAVRDALGDLAVPVLHGVDVGHVPPQLALVNGAHAVVELDADGPGSLVQRLG